MSDNHPITPPPELRRLWFDEAQRKYPDNPSAWVEYIAEKAAQWGADLELDECCEWVSNNCPYFGDFPLPEDKLRAARRFKPPSLKEQALEAVQRFYAKGHEDCTNQEVKDDFDIIRRALEALND